MQTIVHSQVLHPMFEDLVIDLRPLLRHQASLYGLLVPLKKRGIYRLCGKLLHWHTDDPLRALLRTGRQNLVIVLLPHQTEGRPLSSHSFLLEPINSANFAKR